MSVTKTHRDLQQEITDRITTLLEQGVVGWHQPWCSLGHAHHNPISGSIYRGNNPLLLALTAMERGYTDPRWMTKRQIAAKGWTIKDGQEREDTTLYWYKRIVKKDDDTGQRKSFPVMRMFWVLNADQVDHDLPELAGTPDDLEPIEAAADVIQGMPKRPRIEYGGDSAHYIPSVDRVHLPNSGQFESREAFYGVAFHELAHSTGHATRLKRAEVAEANGRDHSSYAREELVAEFTAAMLLAHCGIEQRIEDSAAYIDHWLKQLRDDKSLVPIAAARAQRAADYILDVKWED